jgi:hypothetical protein
MAATNAGPDHGPRGKPQAAIMHEEYQIYAPLENWGPEDQTCFGVSRSAREAADAQDVAAAWSRPSMDQITVRSLGKPCFKAPACMSPVPRDRIGMSNRRDPAPIGAAETEQAHSGTQPPAPGLEACSNSDCVSRRITPT